MQVKYEKVLPVKEHLKCLIKEGLRMMTDEKIKNASELEFAVFCIENVAAKLGVNAERIYQAFTEQSDVMFQKLNRVSL